MQKRYICFTCYGFHPEMKGVSQEEFDAVLEKWVNQDLFEKVDGRWEPKFTVE